MCEIVFYLFVTLETETTECPIASRLDFLQLAQTR